MLRVPAESLAARQFLRIPTLDKTWIRPAGRADKNFPAHTSTKSRLGRKQTRLATQRAPIEEDWLRGLDLNQRPSGYEPDELQGCSTPRLEYVAGDDEIKLKNAFRNNAFHKFENWLQR